MPRSWFSCLLLGLCAQLVACSPLSSDNSELKRLFRRFTVLGPEVNGANFPDPAIIHTDRWYAFATRTIGSSIHIQVATSWDFRTWKLEHNPDGSQYNALPNLPSWVVQGSPNTWAPDVNQLQDGTFIMYYSATTNSDRSKHCVGAATSKHVRGPYTPVGDKPLFCPLEAGGAIDASGYNDHGKRYIVYKIDGNSMGHGGPCGNTVDPLVPTPIKLQPVAADGHTFTGPSTTLLDHRGRSDDGILEAPVVVKKGNTYFLLFSSGCFMSKNYNVGYATAPSITGPYKRAAAPLVATGNQGLSAPGGADVSKDLKFMLLHADHAGGRSLYTAILKVNGQTLSVS